jgi:hypothetical protein
MGSKEEREAQWARRMMLRQLSGKTLQALFGPDGKAKFFSSKEKCLRAGVLPTHNVLSGGLLYVPADANAAFLRAIADANAQGLHNFIVELKNDTCFMMHIDWDYLCDVESYAGRSERQELEMFRVVHDAVRASFTGKAQDPNENERAINFKLVVEYVKTGYHLKWPEVNVTKDKALLVRNEVLTRLEEVLGKRPAYNNWRDVYDDATYGANGLRMPGQCKSLRCKLCHARSPEVDVCGECDFRGFKPLSRPYELAYVLNEDGSLDEAALEELRGDHFKRVRTLSIRVFDTYVARLVPELAKSENLAEQQHARQCVDIEGGENVTPLDLNAMEGNTFSGVSIHQMLGLESTELKACASFVHTHMPGHYRDVKFTSMVCFPPKSGKGDKVWFLRTNPSSPASRYCMNFHGYHQSNTVYFQFTRFFCVQRCYSKKHEHPRDGPPKRRQACSRPEYQGSYCCCCYRSQTYPIPQDLSELLFGKEQKELPPDVMPFSEDDFGGEEMQAKVQSVAQCMNNPRAYGASLQVQGMKRARVDHRTNMINRFWSYYTGGRNGRDAAEAGESPHEEKTKDKRRKTATARKVKQALERAE